jgi:hypothetical protein
MLKNIWFDSLTGDQVNARKLLDSWTLHFEGVSISLPHISVPRTDESFCDHDSLEENAFSRMSFEGVTSLPITILHDAFLIVHFSVALIMKRVASRTLSGLG